MPRMHFKQRLRQGETVAGYMCLIPSAVSAQAIAAAGADFIIIDQEHGPIGPESLHEMIAATAGTSCASLVRVPTGDEVWVKRALDAGAEGICFPLINSAEDASHCVSLMRYPPHGTRGWGPFVAHARWGAGLLDYLPECGDDCLSMLTIETAAVVDHIEDICSVDGIDCLAIGSFDLSTDLGVSGQFDAPVFRSVLDHLERVINEAGIPLGGAAMSEMQTRELLTRRYRILLHGFDVLMLGSQVCQAKTWRV